MLVGKGQEEQGVQLGHRILMNAFEQQELFPIREVSRLTGVNPVTLGIHALVCQVPSWRAKLRSKLCKTGWGQEFTRQYYYLCGYKDRQP